MYIRLAKAHWVNPLKSYSTCINARAGCKIFAPSVGDSAVSAIKGVRLNAKNMDARKQIVVAEIVSDFLSSSSSSSNDKDLCIFEKGTQVINVASRFNLADSTMHRIITNTMDFFIKIWGHK
ncbi:hypothetical protein NQ317_014188 [Molorchus minor]|uniref:Uncharacterized protein n=1 Tax=Molorchus minor TaxID=1323400 RepID=A0ABQ9JJK1_9CUCU|nr:hypothetical protein NQ317_014188 [Molorchus minor]